MSSRSIVSLRVAGFPSFSWMKIYIFRSLPWYPSSYIYIYHISICSSVYRHLDYFYILTIVNSAAINLRMQISLQYLVFISFGYVLSRDIIGSHDGSIFNFLRNLFSIVTILIYILTNWVETFLVKWDRIFVQVEEAVDWWSECSISVYGDANSGAKGTSSLQRALLRDKDLLNMASFTWNLPCITRIDSFTSVVRKPWRRDFE